MKWAQDRLKIDLQNMSTNHIFNIYAKTGSAIVV